VRFVESKQGPPCRAYLKLWEVFSRIQKMPAPGDACLDAGASPGRWTWALQQLGASVLAGDRADPAPEIMRLAGVTFRTTFLHLTHNKHELTWISLNVSSHN
jgi:23S rRNA (cytidine2498-2'-O)-methyltransferase